MDNETPYSSSEAFHDACSDAEIFFDDFDDDEDIYVYIDDDDFEWED